MVMKKVQNLQMDGTIDPFIVKNGVDFHYQKNKFNVDVQLEPGTQVRGLKQLKLMNVDVRLHLFSALLNITTNFWLDKLRLDGRYELKGKALSLIPIKGKGDFWVEMEQLTGFMNISIDHNGTQWAVQDRIVYDFNFAKLKYYFKNLVARGFSKIANTVMNGFSKQLVSRALMKNDQAREQLGEKLKHKIDKQLKKMNKLFVKKAYSYVGLGLDQDTESPYADEIFDSST